MNGESGKNFVFIGRTPDFLRFFAFYVFGLSNLSTVWKIKYPAGNRIANESLFFLDCRAFAVNRQIRDMPAGFRHNIGRNKSGRISQNLNSHLHKAARNRFLFISAAEISNYYAAKKNGSLYFLSGSFVRRLRLHPAARAKLYMFSPALLPLSESCACTKEQALYSRPFHMQKLISPRSGRNYEKTYMRLKASINRIISETAVFKNLP